MDDHGRIRVLFPYVGDDPVGGSHVSSLALVAWLDRRLVTPVILVHGAPAELGRYLATLGLEHRRLDGPGVLAAQYKERSDAPGPAAYLFRTLPALVRFLRQERIDIVHTNDGGMHVTWALPARLAGARHVWHHRQSPEARGANLVAPLLADRILSVSRFARPSRPIRDISARFEVLHSPFELPSPHPDRAEAGRALRAEIGARPEAILLGYFGALIARKRPDHFVRVVAAVRAAAGGRPVHGVVFGKEEIAGAGIAAACHDLAGSLGIAERLHMMGHRSPVEPLIAGVDVLAVTALDEPFGRTLIEAMLIGTPVVATRHGGNPEAIVDGETGFLVDPAEPEAFVAPILRLAEETELRRRIAVAAQRFARTLSTEAHVARVTQIYRELASRRAQTGDPGRAGIRPPQPGADPSGRRNVP